MEPEEICMLVSEASDQAYSEGMEHGYDAGLRIALAILAAHAYRYGELASVATVLAEDFRRAERARLAVDEIRPGVFRYVLVDTKGRA